MYKVSHTSCKGSQIERKNDVKRTVLFILKYLLSIVSHLVLIISFQAYQMWKKQNNELVLPTLKLSDNQLFFIGSAQVNINMSIEMLL